MTDERQNSNTPDSGYEVSDPDLEVPVIFPSETGSETPATFPGNDTYNSSNLSDDEDDEVEDDDDDDDDDDDEDFVAEEETVPSSETDFSGENPL